MSVPVAILEQQLIGVLSGGGNSAARETFRATYENNSVLLFGGIASQGPMSLQALLGPNIAYALMPLPGGNIVAATLGTYPFANQATAANAIIADLLRISMRLVCPAAPADALTGNVGGASPSYSGKNALFTALGTSLQKHNALGGVYSVLTPAYTYTNCILTAFTDISDSQSDQVQWQWRLDFVQPLISQTQAQQALNSLMTKVAAQTPVMSPAAWSSPANGNSPAGMSSNVSPPLGALGSSSTGPGGTLPPPLNPPSASQ